MSDVKKVNNARVLPRPDFIINAGLGNAKRVRDLAKAEGVDVARATERFTLEASLRRIFDSEHAKKFGFITLKGGSLMYFSEGVSPIEGRATKDIDIELAGYQGTLEDLKSILQEVLSKIPAVDDGVRFHTDAMTTNPVAENRAVPGGSISCPVQIGQSIYTFKVDAGFHPAHDAEHIIVREYETLIPKKLPPFQIYCRPLEFSLADKIQACSRHGLQNTRLRDYYDLMVFFSKNEIDDTLAAKAVAKVFELYQHEDGVPLSVDDFPALGTDFIESNTARWEAIREQGDWVVEMPTLEETVTLIRDRVQPILDIVHNTIPKP